MKHLIVGGLVVVGFCAAFFVGRSSVSQTEAETKPTVCGADAARLEKAERRIADLEQKLAAARKAAKAPRPNAAGAAQEIVAPAEDGVGIVMSGGTNVDILAELRKNLSEEEFPLKEHEIPVAIRDFVTKGILEIIWTSGNFKAFKKFIPTMKKYPTDVIIAIDDDFIYPEDLIKTFIDKHKQSPDSPLSGNHFLVNGSNAHCGCASLVKADYYGKYIDELLDERVLELRMDDIFYEFCAALNGVRYQYVGKLFYTNMRPIHAADGLSDFGRDDANEAMTQYLVQKIKKRYHIDMTKIHKPFFSL